MPVIKIDAADLRQFGGIEIFMDNNNFASLSSLDVELTGNFDADCMATLINYLQKRQTSFKSLRLSKDVNDVPCILNYSPARTIIVSQGIHKIGDFSICNCSVNKLVISSSVQNIGLKAFRNSTIHKIEISSKNVFFSMQEHILINNLTGAIVAFESDFGVPKIIENMNKAENVKLWENIKSAYDFSLEGPVFWKNNYAEKKAELKKVQFPDNGSGQLEALQFCLSKNIDAEGNLFFMPFEELWYRSDGDNLRLLVKILKSLTGEQRAVAKKIQEESVLFYTTSLFHPGKELLIFFQAENGIEFIAPEMNLYLFFPNEEINLIPSYLDYLKLNFVKLTKAYSLEKGNPDELLKTEDISQSDRSILLDKLKPDLSNEKLVNEYMNRIKHLARTHHFEVSVTKNNEDFKIRLDQNNTKLRDDTFAFESNEKIETFITETEKAFSELDKDFAEIEQAIKFFNEA